MQEYFQAQSCEEAYIYSSVLSSVFVFTLDNQYLRLKLEQAIVELRKYKLFSCYLHIGKVCKAEIIFEAGV